MHTEDDSPPDILIFLRIPKTGGTSLERPLERCFPGAARFDASVGATDSALLMRPLEKIAVKYGRLSEEQRRSIRCVSGTHFALGIHTILDRPAKYFTIVRDPVDRVISSFYYLRGQRHIASYPFIKDMTLEAYLESGIGLDPFDHQVRMLSGCAELDAMLDAKGKALRVPPVERRHLEMAKRNIEELFLTAAPLEEFTALLLLLRRIYGWKRRQIVFGIRNETRGRPRREDVPAATVRKIEACNRFDAELHEWVKERFARQIAAFEPQFSRERRTFESFNRLAQTIDRATPSAVRRHVSRLFARA